MEMILECFLGASTQDILGDKTIKLYFSRKTISKAEQK